VSENDCLAYATSGGHGFIAAIISSVEDDAVRPVMAKSGSPGAPTLGSSPLLLEPTRVIRVLLGGSVDSDDVDSTLVLARSAPHDASIVSANIQPSANPWRAANPFMILRRLTNLVGSQVPDFVRSHWPIDGGSGDRGSGVGTDEAHTEGDEDDPKYRVDDSTCPQVAAAHAVDRQNRCQASMNRHGADQYERCPDKTDRRRCIGGKRSCEQRSEEQDRLWISHTGSEPKCVVPPRRFRCPSVGVGRRNSVALTDLLNAEHDEVDAGRDTDESEHVPRSLGQRNDSEQCGRHPHRRRSDHPGSDQQCVAARVLGGGLADQGEVDARAKSYAHVDQPQREQALKLRHSPTLIAQRLHHGRPLSAYAPVDLLAQQVGVTHMPGVLLDHPDQHLA